MSTLEEAFERYWWDSCNYAANETKLEQVQTCIRTAMALDPSVPDANDACQIAVSKVLEWGAGGTGLRLYTANMAWACRNQATLACRLREGRIQIESDTPNLLVFKAETGPRMNAGYTKVFALACNASVIYDGRVGAALGLLARMFCEVNQLHSVPTNLAFRWSAQTASGNTTPLPRNPSRGCYTFGSLRNDSRLWAAWNIRANWILCEARAKASARQAQWCMGAGGLRRIEAALFTMGYHLPTI